MAIPVYYSFRNLGVRWMTTVLTAGGMGLVVFVFAAMLMLSQGLKETLVATGSLDNALVIRRSSQAEVQSVITKDQAAVIRNQPEIATDEDGRPLAINEVVALISLKKKGDEGPGNVMVRGTRPESLLIRRQVKLIAGEMFRDGSLDLCVGKSIASGFQGVALGSTLTFSQRQWRVAGILDGGGSGFDSEIWGDVEQIKQAFRRIPYSSVMLTLRDRNELPILKERLETDPRLTVDVKPEIKYYEDQSEIMARFIRILGLALTMIFSIGAVLGAMITMYAAVANRTVEVGTLRALGFRRRDILLAFLMESLLLSLIGGLTGLGGASLMQLVKMSTTNWASFAELSFSFRLTWEIVLQTLTFALGMGLIGGLLPAFRAARLNIVEALRAK
ncbi:MAG: ABC transporter permease [Deltaproteobacteria bacterium]|nr:ABC transporter permease [Deltaproteobacteria bacterium]